MNLTFWTTTLMWGLFGLLNIYVMTPETYSDFWLGWFGTQMILGIIGTIVRIIQGAVAEVVDAPRAGNSR